MKAIAKSHPHSVWLSWSGLENLHFQHVLGGMLMLTTLWNNGVKEKVLLDKDET